MLDPVNNIFGQLQVEAQATQTRLHIRPSSASMDDLQRLGDAELPYINLDIPEADTKASAAHGSVPETLQFTDRSFGRATLVAECKNFMT